MRRLGEDTATMGGYMMPAVFERAAPVLAVLVVAGLLAADAWVLAGALHWELPDAALRAVAAVGEVALAACLVLALTTGLWGWPRALLFPHVRRAAERRDAVRRRGRGRDGERG